MSPYTAQDYNRANGRRRAATELGDEPTWKWLAVITACTVFAVAIARFVLAGGGGL